MSLPDPWIQTFTGKAFHLLAPTEAQVDLRDIAHALAHKSRFTGHTQVYYSVAQHCTVGARLLPEGPLRLTFLLHELGEVWLPDIAAPLKPFVRWWDGDGWEDWRTLEALHSWVACSALGETGTYWLLTRPEIRQMDLAMLVAERDQLLGPALPGWGEGLPPPAQVEIVPQGPVEAEMAWLAAFEECTR